MRISDWSSDVCSSDLRGDAVVPVGEPHHLGTGAYLASFSFMPASQDAKAVSLDAVVQGAERRIARKHLSSRAELPVIVDVGGRSEEHTSELQSLMRISYAVFRLTQNKQRIYIFSPT